VAIINMVDEVVAELRNLKVVIINMVEIPIKEDDNKDCFK
jgi:hypothetical protein